MPTCSNCQQQWTWKQTCKAMMTLNDSYHCPHCNTISNEKSQGKVVS